MRQSDRTLQTLQSGLHCDKIGRVISFSLPDGTTISKNDCIYLVCDTPSEPYYIARLMEFTKSDPNSSEIDAIRLNWFYRPRDIQRQHSDARLLFATMHSDISPLSCIQGKCHIEHKTEIKDINHYRQQPDFFYYDRLFDKFMRRQYEVIPVAQVINVPDEVKEVLLKTWKFVVVEVNRSKELAMDHRACKRCNDWCASKDSVRCALCQSDFHLHCLQPPLPRKPTRGFAWSCTPCSRAEALRRDDSDSITGRSEGEQSIQQITEILPDKSNRQVMEEPMQSSVRPQEDLISDIPIFPIRPSPDSNSRPKELWPYRYLGIHCNVADAVDQDDWIYPRAASRIGPRYQAAVQEWPGRPIQYFERVKRPIKRTAKAMKGRRSDERAAIEIKEYSDLEGVRELSSPAMSEQRLLNNNVHSDVPPDILDTIPKSAKERPLWLQERPPNFISRGGEKTSEVQWIPREDACNADIDVYLKSTRIVANKFRTDPWSSDFLDVALKVYLDHDYVEHDSVAALRKKKSTEFSRPAFTAQEVLRFESSVHLNGNDMLEVAKDVASRSVADCVRYYYIWKKTAHGARTWSSCVARKSKRVVGAADDKAHTTDQLTFRQCIGQNGDNTYKTTDDFTTNMNPHCKHCTRTASSRWHGAPGISIDERTPSLLCDSCAELWKKYAIIPTEDLSKRSQELLNRPKKRKVEDEGLKKKSIPEPHNAIDRALVGTPANKKSSKSSTEKSTGLSSAKGVVICAICRFGDAMEFLTCSKCGLEVHSQCWQSKGPCPKPWLCDVCTNMANPVASQVYICVLCPIQGNNKTTNCLGPLKRTSGNNWAHVTCAIWHQELRFITQGDFQIIDGIANLPLDRWQAICEICHTHDGACSSCLTCGSAVHVECAIHEGYVLGFDIQPVKSSQSRRDSLSLVRIGSISGLMTPVLHCTKHDMRRTQIITMNTNTVAQLSALALYIQTYRSSRNPVEAPVEAHTQGIHVSNVSRLIEIKREEFAHSNDILTMKEDESHYSRCSRCGVEYSPYWHRIPAIICVKCHWSRDHTNGTSRIPLDTVPQEFAGRGPRSGSLV